MPRRPCSCFTGREALLETLAERLRPGSGGPATIALCGPAGIGKSETARVFVHRHGRRYAAIEWVRASSERQLAAGYGRIIERRGSPADRAEPRDRVHAWLETFPDWLLVLDGVPNPKVLKGYLPAAGIGSVLITSRYAAWRGRGRALSVGPLALHEAVGFLLARTGQSDADAARVVAEELGCLPLALEEAAAHCREGAVPLSQFARRLQEDLESALSLGASSSTGPRAVARVWKASLRSVSETSPGAYDLLRILSFLAPEQLWQDDLRAVGGLLDFSGSARRAADPRRVPRLLEALRCHSLVHTEPLGTVSVHRLVQAVVRASIQTREERGRFAGAAVRLVAAAYPRQVERHDQWPACARLTPHARAAANHARALGCELAAAREALRRVDRYVAATGAI